MTKKFFSVCVEQNKYRVFLDDLNLIVKRIKKSRPKLPTFIEAVRISSDKEQLINRERLSDETAEES